MKRALAASVVFAAVFGVYQLAANGAGAAPAGPTTTDITFKEGFCFNVGSHCKTVGGQNAFGGRLIFTIPLSAAGAPIGYEQGECVNLQPKILKNYCTYDLHFQAGSVSVQGTLPLTTEKSISIPITGGTRSYEGAYGRLTLLKGGTGLNVLYQLHIVTPA